MVVSGSEERNLTRLSLVLAAARVPDDLTSWERSWFSEDHLGVTVRVSCVASANDVVPHGIDNDVLFGLVNAYIAAGMPEDNAFQVTAYQLLLHSALPVGGHSYAAVRSSLTRLRNSTYTISNSWYDREEETFQSLSTSLVQNWKVLERRRSPKDFDEASGNAEALYSVTLDPDLARSVRLGYIRPVDMRILQDLSQPLARTLYRRLEDERQPVGEAWRPRYATPLLPWAERLGIQGRPDTIRRALLPAHNQLLEIGFLREVEYVGRGRGQAVHYRFAPPDRSPAQPEAVAALTSRRVTQAAALRYASEFGLEAVLTAVARFDALLRAGYQAKNTSGLLVDILRHPERYEEGAPDAPAPVKAARPASPVAEEPPLERTADTALFALREAPLTDEERALAVALYLSERVGIGQLMSLRHEDRPEALLWRWQQAE